jgi:hypothetical protein
VTREPDDLVRALEEDLVALAAADLDLERDAEVAERTRIERGRLTLLDRVRACGSVVEVSLLGGGLHLGVVVDADDDWFLLGPPGTEGSRQQHLVRVAAVASVRGLGGGAQTAASALPPRTVASVLRGWCRDRTEVVVQMLDGSAVDGLPASAWADHLEVATGRGPAALPYAALASVSRRLPG